MHILLLPYAYPSPDSPLRAIFIKEQARALQEAGHQVGVLVAPELSKMRELFAVRSASDFESRTMFSHDQDLVVYRSRARGWFSRHWSVTNHLMRRRLGYRLFRQYCQEQGRPDVIHAHNCLYAGYTAAYIGQQERIPVVLTEHSSVFLREQIRPNQIGVIRKTLTRVDRCLAVGPSLATAMLEYVPDIVVELVGNVVDTDFFSIVPPPPQRVFVFSLVAVLKPLKRIDLLLHAFSQVFAGMSVRLRIGGDGPERVALEQLARELGIDSQITFLGGLDREKVRELIQGSHVVVSSSEVESFGVTLIEAMACGRPVVSTASGGPEMFVNDTNGILVPVGDTKALALAMQTIRERYDQYALQIIRSQCVARFSKDAITQRLEETYHTLLVSKNSCKCDK